MIQNNESIKGIFKYNPNVTFEPYDLVISNNNLLYYVKVQCQGIDPDTETEGYYKPYSDLQSAKTIEDLVEDNGKLLVPANILAQYLTSLVMGLSMEGSIDVIPYNSSELMIMVDNQVHLLTNVTDQLEISDDDGKLESFEFTNKNLLLRVYRSQPNDINTSIQELIDYENGCFFYRYAEVKSSNITPEWSPWRFIGTSNKNGGNFSIVESMQNRFTTYKALVDEVIANIEKIQENITNFYSFYEVKDENSSWLGVINTGNLSITLTTSYLQKGSICILFVSYKKNGLTFKESVYIDPNTIGVIQTENFSVTISGNATKNIVISSDSVTDIKIDRFIASKCSNITKVIN